MAVPPISSVPAAMVAKSSLVPLKVSRPVVVLLFGMMASPLGGKLSSDRAQSGR
jgi:hypothetical protein